MPQTFDVGKKLKTLRTAVVKSRAFYGASPRWEVMLRGKQDRFLTFN